MNNKQAFQDTLTRHYRELFTTPEYAYSAAKTTPEALAVKMTAGLVVGSASHTGEGIRRTCKEVGIRHTGMDIRVFLAA